MITSDIIARFNLQVDDSSELSSSEELDLANEVYVDICSDRPWEWLKTAATGTTSISVPYIALPSDFKEIIHNTDGRAVVYVGTSFDEYEIIPFSMRRDYRGQDGYCYLDMVNRRLYFTLQPTSANTIEYDYIKEPAALTTSTSPIVTTDQFGKLIAYGMAARFDPIEGANKVTSYMGENRSTYKSILTDLQMEDTNIKLAQ